MMIEYETPGQLTFCPICGKILPQIHFQTFKNGEHDVICKECLTINFSQEDKEKVHKLCKRYDIPVIPKEIYNLKKKNSEKGLSFGKYLSFMKLKIYKAIPYSHSKYFIDRGNSPL